MTLTQAELVLEEKEKYPQKIVDKAANIIMEDYYLDEAMALRRE
jgi:hypothetical protein